MFRFVSSDVLFTREQVAEFLGISLRKLDQLVSQGHFRPRKLGESARLELPEVVRFETRDTAEPDHEDTDAEAGDDHHA